MRLKSVAITSPAFHELSILCVVAQTDELIIVLFSRQLSPALSYWERRKSTLLQRKELPVRRHVLVKQNKTKNLSRVIRTTHRLTLGGAIFWFKYLVQIISPHWKNFKHLWNNLMLCNVCCEMLTFSIRELLRLWTLAFMCSRRRMMIFLVARRD